MRTLILSLVILAAGLVQQVWGQCNCPPLASRPTVVVTDNNGAGTGTTTWTCNNTYVLQGYVFVNSGQALTIEPGTVVKAAAGQGSDASALIVARGGQIFANGNESCPIIFTHQADPLDGSVAYNLSNQWGGVIILGAASTNLSTPNGQVEGIPSSNNRAQYGGTNDADNSGVFRYVSIRHGGTTLAANNEINGLTLAGVGSGTTIDHVEVLANEDDGIEFFGGTVSVNYAIVAFAGDDSFDWDQGWRGSGHHWFSIADPSVGDKGGELDGDDYPNVTANYQPFTTPTVSNWTLIGNASHAATGNGLLLRANSGGYISNAIIVNYAKAIEIEDKNVPSDAYDMWSNGLLTLSNIRAQGATDVIDYDGTQVAAGDANLDAYAASNNVSIANVGIDADWSANASGTAFPNPFNPVPTSDVTATGTYGYMGAFDPNGSDWTADWSFIGTSGIANIPLGEEEVACDCPPLSSRPTVVVTDNNGAGTGTTTWTCNNTYVLQGYVFVNSGQALTIEPGTVVKAAAGQGSDASALIVARGGQIFANGNESCPIIFTHQADPLDGSVAYNLSNQWGGVIILGAASTNLSTPNGQVEGIPSSNNRAQYGGTNDADNSGVFRYVSIRHGGTTLAANNEINGLTLAGVGSGTTIDHVEVLANEDDGIEFFGGTVSVNYAIVAFAGDDSFDWDQGWRGSGHHWFSIADPSVGDKGGELDGDDYPNVTANYQPFTTPTVSNWTLIGNASHAATGNGLLLRANSGGYISNAIIVNYAKAIEIEDKNVPSDAYDMWSNGLLTLSNIRAQGATDVIDYDGTQVAAGDANLDAYAASNNVSIANVGIDADWSANASGTAFPNPFNPVPTSDVTATGTYGYMGAFDPNGSDWTADWSFIGTSGIANIPLGGGGNTDVAGCTNATACNYNAAANLNDGSCVFATGCDSCSGATDGTGTIVDGDADNDGVCDEAEVAGCQDAMACNFNSAATDANDTCVYAEGCDTCSGATDGTGTVVNGDTDGDGVCNVDEIAGCTDTAAANFNPAATDSNTSCQYTVVFRVDMWNNGNEAVISGDFTGGADLALTWANYELYKFSVNLSPGTYSYQFKTAAGVADGINRTVVVTGAPSLAPVCFGSESACSGCMNPEFADFNPHAETAVECTLEAIAGCTYADAENFSAAATVDNGSCTFQIGNDCPSDINGDGVVGTPDLLTFLSSFGTTCE